MQRNKTGYVATALLLAALTGCGYTTTSLIYKNAKTIYVDNFVNRIRVSQEVTDRRMYIAYKSGMELDITREIINRFVMDGNLNIVTKQNADLELDGILIDFKKEALRFDSADNVVEFRVKVIVDLQLVDRKDGKVILAKKGFTGESTYKVGSSLSTNEDQAVQSAIQDLAARVVDVVIEGW
ncbi:MAG: LPS assembly lipoprotein LptE [Candidatus Omnitrophica bacterium]|nr:LPS assembly lipoprotein LptE [Candidatus Omnitrophota bacterium]